MKSDPTAALRGAVFRVLHPLVRVMLRHGMAYGTFAELARKAYVDESLDLLRRAGDRPTISSVAAMSGLTRKEAARLAKIDIDETADADQRYSRVIRVITAWTVDPRFCNNRGEPADLPQVGDNSFADLIRDYSGDMPTAAMLSTLESSDTVEVVDDRVRLKSRTYLPTRTPAASLAILGRDVAELITAIDHNIATAPGASVFQRKVSTTNLRADALSSFRELSNAKSQELLETYDAWLSERETGPDSDSEQDGRYVAVGIYYYDETLDEDDDSETDL